MWIILQPAQNIVLIITLSVGFIVIYLIVIALHYIPIQQGRLVLRAILLKNHYPVLTPTGFTGQLCSAGPFLQQHCSRDADFM